MRRLICAFVICIWHKQVLSWRGSHVPTKFVYEPDKCFSDNLNLTRVHQWKPDQNLKDDVRYYNLTHSYYRIWFDVVQKPVPARGDHQEAASFSIEDILIAFDHILKIKGDVLIALYQNLFLESELSRYKRRRREKIGQLHGKLGT